MTRIILLFLVLTLSACETVRDLSVELDRVELKEAHNG
jgi:hypothetical protein